MSLSYRDIQWIKEKTTKKFDNSTLDTATPRNLTYVEGYLDKNDNTKRLKVDSNLDSYDKDNTSDAKKEIFWFNNSDSLLDGKVVQQQYDPNTDLFKRELNTSDNDNISLYEDPFFPSFEIIFDENSPLFDDTQDQNNLASFLKRYIDISPISYINRDSLWMEFKNNFFKIFQNFKDQANKNKKNSYYITKIDGIVLLNKKIIKYGEDKISITLNEDVAMAAWYLTELYNNLVYSYKDQRFMFPENVLRFNMIIKINDIRNFQLPENKTLDPTTFKYISSPKSQITYQLNDCNFNFFESKNYGEYIEIGGWGSNQFTPQNLTFDIFFKSVTRHSTFPLIKNSYNIDGWGLSETAIKYDTPGTLQNYDSERANLSKNWKGTSYSNKSLTLTPQTTVNTASNYTTNLDKQLRTSNSEVLDKLNPEEKALKQYLKNVGEKSLQSVIDVTTRYADNAENRLREIRGSVLNNLFTQLHEFTRINKIEPDNVYNTDFNNLLSVSNYRKSLASSLLNNLEDETKNLANF